MNDSPRKKGYFIESLSHITFARVIAVLLFLQGVTPAVLFGVWRPGGLLLICLTMVYGLAVAGHWRGRLWASILAITLTCPQLLVFSSPWFSWRFFVFASQGFGLESADTIMDATVFAYRSFGVRLDFAFGYNQTLIADYSASGHPSFLCFNFLAVPLSVLPMVFIGIKLVTTYSSPIQGRTLRQIAVGEGDSAMPHSQFPADSAAGKQEA